MRSFSYWEHIHGIAKVPATLLEPANASWWTQLRKMLTHAAAGELL
jgi:hypothetical protein